MRSNALRAESEFLFDKNELDSGAFPGCIRRVVINESSPELVRIEEGRARLRKEGENDSSFDKGQLNSDWRAHRGLIASIMNVAHGDIQVAMRYENPRIVRFIHRNRLKMLPNTAFDSAITFFFGMQQTSVPGTDSEERCGDYSSFNAYCIIMGWSAPVFRRRLLNIFPEIDSLVETILKEGGWTLAPIAKEA